MLKEVVLAVFKVLPKHFSGGAEETLKNRVTTAGLKAEILTQNLQNVK
jgi:hypothetical protein